VSQSRAGSPRDGKPGFGRGVAGKTGGNPEYDPHIAGETSKSRDFTKLYCLLGAFQITKQGESSIASSTGAI